MIMPIITLRRKQVIIDVDTQRHFFLNTSMIRVQNHREVLNNIKKTVKWAQLKNVRMVSTLQLCDYEEYCRNFYLADECQKKLSCTLFHKRTSIDATRSTDLSPTILEDYNQVIVHKRCFDPFEEPLVDRMLSELQAENFILIGATTEGAVKATALGLIRRRKNVTVLVDAVGSYNRYAGRVTLRLLWQRGAKLTTTNAFLHSLLSKRQLCPQLQPIAG